MSLFVVGYRVLNKELALDCTRINKENTAGPVELEVFHANSHEEALGAFDQILEFMVSGASKNEKRNLMSQLRLLNPCILELPATDIDFLIPYMKPANPFICRDNDMPLIIIMAAVQHVLLKYIVDDGICMWLEHAGGLTEIKNQA